MEIRPFRVAISQESLDDLRNRLDRTRWTSDIPGEGPDYGVDLAWVRRLAGYWRDGYDWRAAEARLNAYPQFITEVDGLSTVSMNQGEFAERMRRPVGTLVRLGTVHDGTLRAIVLTLKDVLP